MGKKQTQQVINDGVEEKLPKVVVPCTIVSCTTQHSLYLHKSCIQQEE